MPDNFFSRGLEALSGLLDFDKDPLTVREQVVQGLHPEGASDDERADVRRQVEELMVRRNVRQPEAVIPDLPDDTVMRPIEDIVTPDLPPPFDIAPPLDVSTHTEQAAEEDWQKTMYDQAAEDIVEENLGAEMSENEARAEHWEEVKNIENPQEIGMAQTPTGSRFMPFKSMEGQGPDKKMSEYEIGYGVKVPQSWFGKDKKQWPLVDGVVVDISKGLTREQAKTMSTEILKISYGQAETNLGSEWDNATEREKTFWADLTYNGGKSAMKKNPNAMRAAKAGLGVEAMVKTLDFIGAGGKKARGLLNRRISMYNQAALGISGAPIIERYEFGPDIKVQFSSPFRTKKMGKKLTKKINENDGWYKVTSGPSGDPISREVNEDFRFEE